MAEPGAPNFPNSEGVPADGEPNAHIRSIWPAIYPELLKLVREHTSTIIFVNARRAAERLAKRLNELANDDIRAGAPRNRARADQESDPSGWRREEFPPGRTPRSPAWATGVPPDELPRQRRPEGPPSARGRSR